MKRLRLLLFLVLAAMALPLTAFAQDVTPPVADDTGLSFSAAVLAAAGIKMLVDWIRRLLPAIDGIAVNLLATALGYGATYIEQIGTFDDWVARLNTAIILAGTSALVSESAKYLRARRAPIVIDPDV